MTIAGDTIMFSDQFPGMPYNVGNHMSLAVISDDMDEIKS
jgi:PhnB protein